MLKDFRAFIMKGNVVDLRRGGRHRWRVQRSCGRLVKDLVTR